MNHKLYIQATNKKILQYCKCHVWGHMRTLQLDFELQEEQINQTYLFLNFDMSESTHILQFHTFRS